MKPVIVSSLLLLSALMSGNSPAAPPVDSDSSHPRTFVADSLITAKIKAKLAEKHLATLANIKVDTDNVGAVWLSGKAPTQDARDLAGMIARDTDGVTTLHNQIIVSE